MGAIHVVHLVSVKDVGAKEHGEQKDDPGFVVQGFPETLKLTAPRGVLHQNDFGAVFTNNLVRVTKEQANH